MTTKTRKPLQQLLVENRAFWDHVDIDPDVRITLEKIIKCGTGDLGLAKYRSANGEVLKVPFTCKSRACSSCGSKSTLDWIETIGHHAPDVPYAGVLLTMPHPLWEIFRENRELLGHLPLIGAGIFQDWAAQRYGAEIFVTTVTHTFGGDLKFHPHLHLVVSLVGLDKSQKQLVRGIQFPHDALMRAWRKSLIDHLRDVCLDGMLRSKGSPEDTLIKLSYLSELWWKIGIRPVYSKRDFLGYIGRYLRRPPISNKNILSIVDGVVAYLAKDTKGGAKQRMTITVEKFISLFIGQVANRYAHGVHYFGLASPRTKAQGYITFMALIDQIRSPRRRHSMKWRDRLIRDFGRDPLIDSMGAPFHWQTNVIPPKTRDQE